MENLLTIQENENSAALIFYSAASQELCTDVNSNVISDVTLRSSARYQRCQAWITRMPQGRTSPALPYLWLFPINNNFFNALVCMCTWLAVQYICSHLMALLVCPYIVFTYKIFDV